MEKQMVVRGVAILCAGLSISVFAAPHIFLDKPEPENALDLAALQAREPEVRSAGLTGSAKRLQLGASDAEPPIPEFANMQADILSEDMAEVPAESMTLDIALADPLREDRLSGEQITDMITTALTNTGPGTAPDGLRDLDLGPQLAFAGNDAADTPDHCTPLIEVTAGPDALVELSLFAPCQSDSRFVASHDDLAFSAFLDADGRYTAYLPALSPSARFDVFLSDDTHLHKTLDMRDVQAHKRVVLQWTGDARFGLHAFHNGAQFGDSGHLHAARPFDPELDEAFLISLGDLRGPEPILAQIYSVPVEHLANARVEVELAFSEADCGRDVMAFVSQTLGTSGTPATELTFSAPDCPTTAGAMVMGLEFASLPARALTSQAALLTGLQ